MKHTKLPLKVYTSLYKITDLDGFVVATTDKDIQGEELSREIVHCVNHFDALIEALEEIVENSIPHGAGKHPQEHRITSYALSKARAALKLAKP